MTNFHQLPSDIPITQDDGAADHLVGMRLPSIVLNATTRSQFNPGESKGRLVIYCYPMTGQPNVALLEGWDQTRSKRVYSCKAVRLEITIKSYVIWVQRWLALVCNLPNTKRRWRIACIYRFRY